MHIKLSTLLQSLYPFVKNRIEKKKEMQKEREILKDRGNERR